MVAQVARFLAVFGLIGIISCGDSSTSTKPSKEDILNARGKSVPDSRKPQPLSSPDKNTASTVRKAVRFSSAKEFISALDTKTPAFRDYVADMSVDAHLFGSELGVSGRVSIRKDSIFWMNITYLGLEVARLKLTNDSIYFVNKFQSSYMISNYQNMYKVLGFTISRADMQSVFLGAMMDTSQGRQRMLQDTAHVTIESRHATKVKIMRFIAQTLLPSHYEIQDMKQFRAMNISFKAFEPISYKDSTYILPSEVVLNFNSQTKLDIELEDVELKNSQFTYPFNTNLNGYKQIK